MSVNDLIGLSLDEIIARGGPKFRTNRRPGNIRRGDFRGGVRRIPIVTSRVMFYGFICYIYFRKFSCFMCKYFSTDFKNDLCMLIFFRIKSFCIFSVQKEISV